MNWLQKISGWEDEIREPLPEINWMEMMPDGRRRWQVSLDKAFQKGEQQYGLSWNQRDELGDYAAKKQVFYDWWERMDGPLTGMISMVNEYVQRTEGFSPLEDMDVEDAHIDIPSASDLDEQWSM